MVPWLTCMLPTCQEIEIKGKNAFTRQHYNAQNSDVSLPRTPLGSGGGDVWGFRLHFSSHELISRRDGDRDHRAAIAITSPQSRSPRRYRGRDKSKSRHDMINRAAITSIAPRSQSCLFKIFLNFWLAQIPKLILHNQLALTKFVRCLQYPLNWHQ